MGDEPVPNPTFKLIMNMIMMRMMRMMMMMMNKVLIMRMNILMMRTLKLLHICIYGEFVLWVYASKWFFLF